MGNGKHSRLIIALACLINLVWLVDGLQWERHARQLAREDELVRWYECRPIGDCTTDFDGDGRTDEVIAVRQRGSEEARLRVWVNDLPALDLPFHHINETLRTRVAIRYFYGKARLLVFDGFSAELPHRAVYSWDGEKMVLTPPLAAEEEILSAMAAHDALGGWNARTAAEKFHTFRQAGYVTGLLVLLLSDFIRRRSQCMGSGLHVTP